MPDACCDVLLITADAAFRDLVQARRPSCARLRCATGAEPTTGEPVSARQAWVDLDSVPNPRLPDGVQRVYFYSQQCVVQDGLPAGLFVHTPCAPVVFDVLWAEVQAGPGAPVVAQGRALPHWVTDFQELNLARLCRKIVNGLAARLGYRDVSLYLHDFEHRQLVLAETTHTRALERSVPLDAAGQHLMVAVARSGRIFATNHAPAELAARGIPRPPDRPYADDACLVAPLSSDGRLWGVLNFSGQIPTALTEERPPLEEIFAFLGRALQHAQTYYQARTEARVDGLTGLYNQRWIQESLEKEIRRAERYGTTLAILMIDLDGLKAINDQYGHTAGDCVLRHVAGRISGVLRQFDGAARVGGDEFIVMLPATNLKGAQHVARRLLESIRQGGPSYHDATLPVTASIGVAEWQPGCDAARLIEAADQAMYTAKQNGRKSLAGEPRSSVA